MGASPALPRVHVAAAAVVRDGRILAAERAYGPHLGFELPGGKVEAGETALAACRRELREELGIEVQGVGGASEPELLDIVSHRYDDFDLTMEVFLCEPVPGSRIEDGEHLRLLWLGRDELLSVAWLPADVELLERLQRRWTAFIPS